MDPWLAKVYKMTEKSSVVLKQTNKQNPNLFGREKKTHRRVKALQVYVNTDRSLLNTEALRTLSSIK